MTAPIVSRIDAIAAKCRDCIYDPLSAGTWREQVAACASASCAYTVSGRFPVPAWLVASSTLSPSPFCAISWTEQTACAVRADLSAGTV